MSSETERRCGPTSSEGDRMTCPTCGADVRIIVDEQCAGCGSERVVDAIERLRPGGGG